MASWQAHLAVMVLKYRIKRHMHGRVSVEAARASVNGAKHPVPARLVITEARIGGVPGEWIRRRLQPGESPDLPGTLFYLHGGAYIACSPVTHRPVTGGFARRGWPVFAPDYRLAPEHPFPAAVDDAVASYRGLLDSGTPPESLVVAGDSAGGGLTLALLLSLRDAGLPLPAAAALFSPWTDLAATGATMITNTKRDAMFPGSAFQHAAKPYLAGQDPRQPLASPLYADLHGLPPMLLHTGSYEVLLDDSVRLAERARAAGVPVTMRTWPVVPHGWQLFPIPEAKQSIDEAAQFLEAALLRGGSQMAA